MPQPGNNFAMKNDDLIDDIVTLVTERIPRDGFGEYMDFQVDDVSQDRCQLRLPLRDVILNAGGIVHGGAISALVDTAATAAAWATNNAAEPRRGTTVGFAINFLNPGRESDLIADARVIQRGGRLTIIDVLVRDDAGTAIAKAQVTYKIALRRPT
jgi:uncharacterized protein (TIGR00369 family)